MAATASTPNTDTVPPRRRSYRRRAAVTVLSFAVVFTLLQVAFHYPATDISPQLRDAHFGSKWVRLRAVATAAVRDGRPLVVMTGSSLTEFGFRPSVMPGQDGSEPGRPICYNLGQRSCGVLVHLLGLRRILDDGIRPDLVLIEIQPQFTYSLFSELYDGDILPPERLFWGDDWSMLDRSISNAAEYRRRWREKQFVPWWSYRGNVQHSIDPELVPQDRRAGFYPIDEWGFAFAPPGHWETPTGYQLNGGGARIRDYYTYFYSHAKYDVRLAEAYCEMAALCRDRGIRCALVAVPETTFTRETRPSDGDNDFARLLARFRHEHLAEVIDARDWVPDDEFVEGAHLLRTGATRFSQRLEREVLRRTFPPSR